VVPGNSDLVDTLAVEPLAGSLHRPNLPDDWFGRASQVRVIDFDDPFSIEIDRLIGRCKPEFIAQAPNSGSRDPGAEPSVEP
jgi:hypothetical protein